MLLLVTGLASNIEPTLQAQYEGRTATIKCVGEVRYWTFNDGSVPADVDIHKNNLKIWNVKMHHTGTYKCLMADTLKWESSKLYVGG